MKSKLKNHLSIILLFALLSGCASPSFIGFQFNEQTTNTIPIKPLVKTNIAFQKEILTAVKLPESVIKSLDINAPLIISNFNLYPFATAFNDSIKPSQLKPIDQNINGEMVANLSKQLLLKGYSLLENDEAYNSLDYNYDEYSNMLNFEIKNFGLYYASENNDKVVRNGVCELRYKVINKNGVLKLLEDVNYIISDTLMLSDIKDVEMPQKTLGYLNFPVDYKLTQLNLPELGGYKVSEINSSSIQNSISDKTSISGLRFKLPAEKKPYKIIMVDYVEFKKMITRLGRIPNANEILSLIPTQLELKANEINRTKNKNGDSVGDFFANLGINDLESAFRDKKEIVFFYKAKKLCAIRKNDDGSYSEIQ